MVHPGSAAVISAASSARPPGPSAIAVTPSRLPGPCGAATVTATSAVRSSPGGGFSMTNGRRVVTPGPSTRTVTGAGAGTSAPGGSPVPGSPPATVTRTTWHGPLAVLTNNGVDSACTIRMTSSSHAAAGRPPYAGPVPGAPGRGQRGT